MKINESTNTSVLKPIKGTRKWLVRLITEGQGSTGVYTKEALQGSFAEAFPVGTHMYIDHATEVESDERPEGFVEVGGVRCVAFHAYAEGTEGRRRMSP